MEKQNKKQLSFVAKMAIALVAGVACGLLMMALREYLNGSGQEAVWTTINNLLFQDVTAAGGETALGLFYIAGQLFIRALQLVIVPMVFTSIVLAIGQITDMTTLKRISFKTVGWFLIYSFFALLLAGVVGMIIYNAGLFNVYIEGLESTVGKTGTNPMTIILNVIPSNIFSVFTSNTAVLSIVFLAVSIGLCMNVMGVGKTETFCKLVLEINDMITVFLNFVITKFGPIAIFLLLTRTFATYGIHYLKPALVYMLVTTILLFVYLIVAYPAIITVATKLNPVTFVKKITKVAVFGFSTSSSAATLPLNYKTCTEEFGVGEEIASFALPLGMTINMNGTAIMQVVATLFIAGCGGYDVSVFQLVVIAFLALIASAGTPAAPGAGAIILFTILSGVGITNDAALLAYTLILAINRPIEMLVTSLNVVGDAATSIIVAKSENLLDEDVYNS